MEQLQKAQGELQNKQKVRACGSASDCCFSVCLNIGILCVPILQGLLSPA